GNIYGASGDPPSPLDLFRCRLQRPGVKRGDHDVLVRGHVGADLEHVIHLMRRGFQPPILALHTVKHCLYYVSQAVRLLATPVSASNTPSKFTKKAFILRSGISRCKKSMARCIS